MKKNVYCMMLSRRAIVALSRLYAEQKATVWMKKAMLANTERKQKIPTQDIRYTKGPPKKALSNQHAGANLDGVWRNVNCRCLFGK